MERTHCLGAIETRVSAMKGSEEGGAGRGVSECVCVYVYVWGGQVPQKSGSGCSGLAAHHGSSQVNVKT